MNSKAKFAKLRLPNSNRNNATTSQPSAFFATSQPTDSHSCSSPIPSTSDSSTPSDSSKSTISAPSSTVLEDIRSYKSIVPEKIRRIESTQTRNSVTIRNFFNQSSNEDDFETPKKIVRKPSDLGKAKRPKKAAGSDKGQRQPKIKMALLKREQIMSNFIAEQSLMENVDPNEMQMALALSRSEAEVCKIDITDNTDDSSSSNTMECIREKLEEFGYRPNAVKKSSFSFYAARKVRTKWANKFTSLTMRNPERQLEKVNKKIEQLMNIQCRDVADSYEESSVKRISIASALLLDMQSSEEISLRQKNSDSCDLEAFYVTGVFEPTINKPGNLLKQFDRIPGRDPSPARALLSFEKETVSDSGRENCSNTNDSFSKANAGSPEKSTKAVANEDHNFVREGSPDLFFDEEEIEMEISSRETGDAENLESVNSANDLLNLGKAGNIPSVDSGDITKVEGHFDVVTVSSDSGSNHIVTMERFSSDEVKTSKQSGIWNQDLNYTLRSLNEACSSKTTDEIVDLTQEDNFVDLTQVECDLNDFDSHEINFNVKNTSSPAKQILTHLEEKEEVSLSQDSSLSVIVLSDDEVNYSINAAKALKLNESLQHEKSESDENTELDVSKKSDKMQSALSGPFEFSFEYNWCNSPPRDIEQEQNLSLVHDIMAHSFLEEFDKVTPTENDSGTQFSTDDAFSIDLTQTSPGQKDFLQNNEPERPKSFPRSASDSRISRKRQSPKVLKRYFTESVKEDSDRESNSISSDFDEFDRLVYHVSEKPKERKKPDGIERLLASNIKASSSDEKCEEMVIDGKTYLVKTVGVQEKPDYQKMDEPKLLRELYKYGLKPLKKKQAVIMLDFIYNQTHPCLVERLPAVAEPDTQSQSAKNEMESVKTRTDVTTNKLDLKDCSGSCLLIEDGLEPHLENEVFIFQTNTRAKNPTALLPLHIAWYNLVKSNRKLREAVLYYEPIDLKEIYAFFRNIGYRYDPKDLKTFFDSRSIIFQYDVNKAATNRHVRNKRKAQWK